MEGKDGPPVIVAALYKFVSFGDPGALRRQLLDVCLGAEIKGTLLLAPEGINGTVAGTRAGVDAVIAHIRGLPGCDDLEWKESHAAAMPFRRMKVRLKREIVTMGVTGIDPSIHAGTYVDAKDWNALIGQPDVIVIDTRNDYEVGIGTFEGAINPATASFRAFPSWFDGYSRALGERGEKPRIAMFCTGGIRCEKSTAYLKSRGIGEVYHLKGGILKYLEVVPETESRWRGECFVFDERVSVRHGLVPGSYRMCGACGVPVGADAMTSLLCGEDVRCPDCQGGADGEGRPTV